MIWKENNKIVNNKETTESTDKYLKIDEIRWDSIVMKDSSLRSIIKCSWLNIDLKNSQEEQIVADKYSRILNSLDFPIQILIRSTNLDLSDYLEYIKENIEKIDNEVLKWQWQNYFDFINNLNQKQWLLFTKEFYIIVPYYWFEEAKKIRESQFAKFMSALSSVQSAESIANNLRRLYQDKKHLNQRCTLLQGKLQWIGLEVKRLWFEEIVALLFEVYNPSSLKKQSEIIIN